MPIPTVDDISILVVEDSELDFELLVAILRRDPALAGCHLRAQRVEDEDGMRAALAHTRFDAVITDHNMPRFDSFQALQVARASDDHVPVIVVSGEMSEELAVAALHAGADDFILKSRMFRLGPALRRSLQAAQDRHARHLQAQEIKDREAQLQELAQHLERIKEEERRAIAREIHDDIGTTLTALKFELVRLTRSLGERPSAAPHINAMQALITQAVAASHRIQHNLHPPVLDAGLVAALEWLVKDFSQRTGLDTQFETNREDIDLPAERAAALYRVAQESLTNTAKHAQASRVGVHLFVSSEEIVLEVTDNGVGFDPRILDNTPGFGVRSLTERARGLSGWAEINAAAGQGCTVMFSIPLTNAQTVPLDATPNHAAASAQAAL
ncbi:MAG TPA: response regulator [Burkholderiaceae bacterium]|nr:response regulator [Burkholderiaceae bacterium]